MNDGSAPQGRLERWYRRLLRAYPRHYRRYRSEEMLTTLLDGATPGQKRPTPRMAGGLILAGIRYRFRLRRDPATRGAAVFASVICGVLVGIMASWLAWQCTKPPQPDDLRSAAIVHVAVPQAPQGQSRFFPMTSPGQGPFDDSSIEYTFDGSAGPDHPSLAAVARDRLRADGWSISRFRQYDTDRRQGVRAATVIAYKDGVQVRVDDYPPGGAVRVTRAEPMLVPVSMAAGVVLGGLLGWLVTGVVSRRTAGQPLGQWVAMMVLSIVAAGGLLPLCGGSVIVAAYGYLDEGQPGAPWSVLWDSVLHPITEIGVVVALATVLLAFLPRGEGARAGLRRSETAGE